MSPEVSEHSFEDAIERGLLQNGPDAYAGEAAVVRYKLADKYLAKRGYPFKALVAFSGTGVATIKIKVKPLAVWDIAQPLFVQE